MHRRRYAGSPHKRPLVSGLSLKARRKDGRRFDAEISLTPVRTKQGLLVSTAIRDISQASASEAYFKHLLETAPDAMIIVDQNGRIAIANDQAVKMFGYSRSQLLDQPVDACIPLTQVSPQA